MDSLAKSAGTERSSEFMRWILSHEKLEFGWITKNDIQLGFVGSPGAASAPLGFAMVERVSTLNFL